LFTLNIDEVLRLIYPPLKRKFETDDVCANDKFAPKPP